MVRCWNDRPIADSEWVSPIHIVTKKGGTIVVQNKEGELVPTRVQSGWRVCIDYRNLNKATKKDHCPLPFMGQMLERLAGRLHYCFLDGYSGYIQVPKAPENRKKNHLYLSFWHLCFQMYAFWSM